MLTRRKSQDNGVAAPIHTEINVNRDLLRLKLSCHDTATGVLI